MNRLSAALPRVAARLRELSAEKVERLRATTELEAGEKFDYQQLQAESHAGGLLSLEEATFIYQVLNRWDDRELAEKLVVLNVLGELALARLAKRTPSA